MKKQYKIIVNLIKKYKNNEDCIDVGTKELAPTEDSIKRVEQVLKIKLPKSIGAANKIPSKLKYIFFFFTIANNNNITASNAPKVAHPKIVNASKCLHHSCL